MTSVSCDPSFCLRKCSSAQAYVICKQLQSQEPASWVCIDTCLTKEDVCLLVSQDQKALSLMNARAELCIPSLSSSPGLSLPKCVCVEVGGSRPWGLLLTSSSSSESGLGLRDREDLDLGLLTFLRSNRCSQRWWRPPDQGWDGDPRARLDFKEVIRKTQPGIRNKNDQEAKGSGGNDMKSANMRSLGGLKDRKGKGPAKWSWGCGVRLARQLGKARNLFIKKYFMYLRIRATETERKKSSFIPPNGCKG